MSLQSQLPLRPIPLEDDEPLLPVRMVNEFVYCPRLAYLEWVQGEWAHSEDTMEGRRTHRRVDQPSGALGDGAEEETIHARSVSLESRTLGITATLDLVEATGHAATPVDYKKGKRPHVAKGAWEPERVQVCAQGLLLREHGYAADYGILYFAGSRERVRVDFDAELVDSTVSAINGLRTLARAGRIPPPLEDSPKCPRCSLVGICLPDEVNFLKRNRGELRPIAVPQSDALPLYVQDHRASIRKNGFRLEIRVEDQVIASPKLKDISQLAIIGNAYVTTPSLHELMKRGIPVAWHSYGGWFLGFTEGLRHKNVELRTAQYRASFDPESCLRLARSLVHAKIRNARTLLRRNWRADSDATPVLNMLARDAKAALRAETEASLLGIEGTAAARYFRALPNMIKQPEEEALQSFQFARRNRRPPADPVNALLSFSYAMLTRTLSVTLTTVGFDVYRGLFHKSRYGRPALALDFMEPFRPIIADSAVISAINNGETRPSDFITRGDAVALSPDGRKRFIGVFERRLEQLVTHPLFGYRITYRRLFELQARLLGRYLLGEIDSYPNFMTR